MCVPLLVRGSCSYARLQHGIISSFGPLTRPYFQHSSDSFASSIYSVHGKPFLFILCVSSRDTIVALSSSLDFIPLARHLRKRGSLMRTRNGRSVTAQSWPLVQPAGHSIILYRDDQSILMVSSLRCWPLRWYYCLMSPIGVPQRMKAFINA